MSVAPQKIANKSMTSLILGSQLQSKTYYHKKKRRGHIYFDSQHYVPSSPATSNANTDLSSTSYFEEEDQPIDPSTIHRISNKIQDSFYSMSEADPLSNTMRSTQESKSWPLIYYQDKKYNKSKGSLSYFKLKEIDVTDHEHIDITQEMGDEQEYVYYYDHEQEQQKIFYKQLNLNVEDIFKNKRHGKASKLDLVLNEYHSTCNLPDIEHYFILLYYNIKKSNISQLQQLWTKLFHLFQSKMSQNVPVPTIYINFKNGEQPTDVNGIFDMLYHPEFGIDLMTLKEVVKEYYHQWHPKCIMDRKRKAEQKKELILDRFGNMDEKVSMEEADDEYRSIFGYNSDAFWSMTDGASTFPVLPDGYIRSPTPRGDVEDITPFVDDRNGGGTIFGFALKPKSAVKIISIA